MVFQCVSENKGIAFKARLAYTTRYEHGRAARTLFKWNDNDEGIARVIPRKNNGHPVFIYQAVQLPGKL